MPPRFPAASWLAAFLFLPLLGAAQVQEWAYHEPDHLDHSHVLTWPDWGTDRIIAAVAHTDLGTYNSGTTSSTPQGTSILTRQKDDGTLIWQTKLGSNFLLRLSDMKVIPGTDGEEIALVGHRRLSLTGTFSDRGVLFIVSSVDGSLLHEYSLESDDPQDPIDSRLLGLEFYNYDGNLNLACTGWTGDVTSTGGNHRGLYLRFGYQISAPPVLLAGWELNSTTGGADHDYLGKAVDIGTGIAVVGSTNPLDFNGDVHQAAMAALFDYDGTPIWGQGYREFIQPSITDHTVAADIMKVDDGFLLAMNHFAGSGMSLSSFNPTNGNLVNTQFVHVPPSISSSQNIKAFDIELHPEGGWIVGGYIKDHEWVDTNAVSQKGNIPYFLTGTIDAVSGEVLPADMKAMKVPSKGAGETVNNWAYAPYPNDHEQPWVYHPEMLALEAEQDPNIDLILTGYRERSFNPNAFNLNIIPTDLAASTGPCDSLEVPFEVSNGVMESYDLPQPTPVNLLFEPIAVDPQSLTLGIMDCGELMPPPICSLPTSLMESVNCLSVDIETAGGFTPPIDIHYSWNFGDGTTLSGINLNQPATHIYASAGTYTISMTAYCLFDAATTTTLTRTVTVEDCGEDNPCSVGPYDLDFWLFCGQGCFGATGTQSAVSVDLGLWDLSESEYDAQLNYSDGTSIPLHLDQLPMSYLKCFSGLPFQRSVCLVVYEEGGEAAGDSPCYEVCASDGCIQGPLPGTIRDMFLPEISFNSTAGACSIDVEPLPENIQTEVSLMAFDTPYPGGGNEAEFVAAFMAGENFADAAVSVPGSSGDYGPADTTGAFCPTLHATVNHPVVVAVEDDNGVALYSGGNPVGIEFLSAHPHAVVLTRPKLQVNAVLFTEEMLPFDVEEESQPLVMIDPTTYNGAVNAWGTGLGLQGLSFGDLVAEEADLDLCNGILAQANQAPNFTALQDGLLTYTAGSNAQLIGYDGEGQGLGFIDQGITLVADDIACPPELSYFAEFEFSALSPQHLLQGGQDLEAAGTETRAFQVLTTMDGSLDSGAPLVPLVVEFDANGGNGLGASSPWTLSASDGTTVASGSIPEGVLEYSEDILVPDGGSYTFSIEPGCAASASSAILTVSPVSNPASPPYLSMEFDELPPGLGSGPVDLPTVVISPPNTYAPDSLCNAVFTHDLLPTGPVNSLPYEVVALENNILLSFAPIENGTSSFYRDLPPWSPTAFPALPLAGSGQVLFPGPTTALYDFTAFSGVQEVSFVYVDGAGYDNLMVNGHQLYVGEIESMPSGIAPGVALSVNSTRYPGYEVGLVTLTGDIQTLRVGGTQMVLDNICVKFTGQVDNPFGCDAHCDALFDFEDLPLGNSYGDPGYGATVSTPPGAPVSTINGVTMSLVPVYSAPSNSSYIFLQCESETTNPSQVGSGHKALLANVSARFDIQPAFDVTDTVCVSFGHTGSLSNFSVNGSPVTILTGGTWNPINNLQSLDGLTIGGVAIDVSSVYDPVENVRLGVLTMIGDVDEFDIGGDEFFIDDVCISADEVCTSDPANYFLEVEEVTADVGILSGGNGTYDLTGYATYRLWMNVDDASDFIFGVTGTDVNPTIVESTGSFFHASFGASTPNNINPSFLPVFPELAHDSWVSIGLEQEPNPAMGEDVVNLVTANMPSWTMEFDPGSGAAGSGVLIDSPVAAGWYADPGDANATAGANQKVLLGQFTTNGDLSGQLYVTVHPCGNADEAFSAMYPFGATACADSDGDGVCDDDEIVGCTDPTACNYDPTATDPGVCDYSCNGCDSDPANYFLEVEEVTPDVGVLTGGATTDLTGYGTYRLWMNVDRADDVVIEVSGNSVNPTYVETTGEFFHAMLGDRTPSSINPILFANFPELAYDSWVTIGLEQFPDPNAGEAQVNTVQSAANLWSNIFDPGSGTPGSSIAIDDAVGGAWYALPGDANALAGTNQKVLLGQFTTNGDLSGQLYVTVHPCGNADEAFSAMYPFGATACTDSDGDGVCDDDEIAGCTQAGSTNYNPEATDDDGSCAATNTGLYLTGGTNPQVMCDGTGNASDLNMWLNANGGLIATTGCQPVTWSHDYTALTNGCGSTGFADVTFTAVDACNNTASVTLTFTIVDFMAPVLSNPGQIAANCGSFDPYDISGIVASDACGGVTISVFDVTPVSGCVTPVGAYIRTLQAVDECGNSTQQGQLVVLEDVTAPSLTYLCPPDTVLVPDANCNVDSSPNATGTGQAVVSDDCDAAPALTISHADVMTTSAGVTTITRTWSFLVVDHCGNASSAECDQIITIEGCDNVPGNTGGSDCTATCDELFDFEDLTLGERYGDLSEGATIAVQPGGIVSITNGIPMSIDEVYSANGSGFFSYLESTLAPSSLGSGQKAQLASCAATFDIEPAIAVTDTVCIAYEQQGGDINFSVNGSPLVVDPQFLSLDGDFIQGVQVAVTASSTATGLAGTITLIGDVNTFTVGGFELVIDGVCISEGQACDISFTHEFMMPGLVATGGVFVEDGIELTFLPFDDGTTSNLGDPYIDFGMAGAGSGQVLWMDNTNAHYNLSALGNVAGVELEYSDGGGDENLSVNGSSLFLEFGNEAGSIFSLGGVDVLITRFTGFSASTGKVYLIGDVQEFSVGGQEFYVDNVCVFEEGDADIPTLAELQQLDASVIASMLDFSSYLDTNNCQVAAALNLPEDFPVLTGASVNLIGALTGEVYASSDVLSGAGIVSIPDPANGEALLISITLEDPTASIEIDYPDLEIPGCGGDIVVDPPCSVMATFAAIEVDCGVYQVLSLGVPPGYTVEWTLNGNPYTPSTSGGSFGLAPGSGSELCLHVEDPNDPTCFSDHCALLVHDCGSDSCDFAFTHELMSLGNVASGSTFTEDGIEMHLAGFVTPLGSSIGTALVDYGVAGVGDNQVLHLYNTNADYNLTGLSNVSHVSVEYYDGGGSENLMVNGQLIEIEFADAAGSTFSLGGVDVFITRAVQFGYAHGEILLSGAVDVLAIGGQEFYVDNVCVTAEGIICTTDTDGDGICDEDEVAGCTNAGSINYNPNATDDDGSCDDGTTATNDTTEIEIPNGLPCPTSCDHLVDFSTQTIGESWGAITSNPTYPLMPGDFMFTEDGIDLYVDRLNNAYSPPTYQKNGIVSSPWWAFGSGQVMHTNNATVTFDLDSIPTDSVCLDFLDLGGYEFLEVNGDVFSSANGYGELAAASGVMGGVQVQVIGNPIIQTTSSGPSTVGFNGRIVLIGNVDKLEIGGQEFWIDNLCISEGTSTANAVQGCTYEEASNYDPDATEDDGTCDLTVGNACPTDIDNDGSTTVSDLLLLLGSFSLDCE